MKIYKEESSLVKKVQELEKCLEELGLSLEIGYHGIKVIDKQTRREGLLIDRESKDSLNSFPSVKEWSIEAKD